MQSNGFVLFDDDVSYPSYELNMARVRRSLLSYMYKYSNNIIMNVTHNHQEFMQQATAFAKWHLQHPQNAQDRSLSPKEWLIKKAKELKNDLLALHHFDWLKKNDRACYYAWLNIQHYDYKITGFSQFHASNVV